MKRKLSLILACIMVVGLLGGCGNSFDASAYLKAVLDNSYKNDSSQFVAMKVATAEEAAEIYEEGLDAELDAMLYGVEGLTEAQEDQYRQVIADILARAKYTVGEAKKQDDGSFVVTVTYERMNVYEPAMTACTEMVADKITEWTIAAENGEEVPSEAEMTEWIAMALKDCIEDSLNSVTYDEPQETTVKISLKDNLWTPSTSDLVNLEELLFDYSALQ